MLILENFSFAGMVKLSGGLKNFGHGWLGSKMLSLQLHWRYGVILLFCWIITKCWLKFLRFNTILELNYLNQWFIGLYFCSLWLLGPTWTFFLSATWMEVGRGYRFIYVYVCLCCKGNHSWNHCLPL